MVEGKLLRHGPTLMMGWPPGPAPPWACPSGVPPVVRAAVPAVPRPLHHAGDPLRAVEPAYPRFGPAFAAVCDHGAPGGPAERNFFACQNYYY